MQVIRMLRDLCLVQSYFIFAVLTVNYKNNPFGMKRFLTVLFLAFCFTSTVSAQDNLAPAPPVEVIIFLSPDCPVCQKYMVRLNEIVQTFSNKAKFLGVIPGNVKKKEIRLFKKEYAIKFDVIGDKQNVYVKKYQPVVTPEVIAQDNTKTIRYQGAIDNWFYELGKYRHQPTEYYLVDAIQSVLNGEEVRIKHTEAIGCIIQADLMQSESIKENTHHH